MASRTIHAATSDTADTVTTVAQLFTATAHVIYSPLRESPSISLVVHVVSDSCDWIIRPPGTGTVTDACKISGTRVQPKRQIFGVHVVNNCFHPIRKQVSISFQESSGVAAPVVPRLVYCTCPTIVQVEMPLSVQATSWSLDPIRHQLYKQQVERLRT